MRDWFCFLGAGGWGVGGVPGIDGGLPGLDGDFEGAVDGITRTVSLWFCNSSWEGRTLKIFWYCCSSLKFDIVSFASSVTVYVYGVDVYSCLTGAEYFTFTYNT